MNGRVRDYRITITVRGDVFTVTAEGISMVELAEAAGFLQVFAGQEGLRRGLDIDEVKDNMLDIHLAAMEAIEEQIRAGVPDPDDSS